MKKIVTLLVFIGLCSICRAQWTNLNAPVIQNRAHFYAVGVGDTGYIISGGGAGGYWSNADIFTPSNAQWSALVNYPGGYNNGTNGFVIGDTLYAGTGAQGGYVYSNTFTEYNVHTQQWTGKTTSYNYQGRCSAVCFTIGDTGYTGGGLNSGYPTNNYSNNNPVNDFWRYVPATGVWDTIPHCPARGVGCNAVAFVLNGKAYVGTGGIQDAPGSQTFDPVADFWCYNPATNEWDSITPFGGGVRMSAIAFVTCGHAYVGTGCTDGGQSVLVNDIWAFDPNGGAIGAHGPMGSWTRVSDFSGPPRQNAGCFVIGTHAYIMCGASSGFSITYDDIWKYTPTPAFYGDTLVCSGQQVQFTDTSLFFPDYWSWNFNGGTAVDSTAQNPLVTFNKSGTYSVTLTAWNDCDTGSTTYTSYVSVNPGAVKPVFPKDTAFCGKFNLTLVGGQTQSGVTYLWPTTGDTSSSITVSSFGNYWVNITTGCGTITSDTVTVKGDTNAVLIVNPQTTFVCAGQGVNLVISGGGSNFVWSPSAGLSATSGDSVLASPTATVTYNVYGLDSAGCPASDSGIIVTVIPSLNKPTITVSANGDTLISSAGSYNQWFFDNQPIQNATGKVLVITGHQRGYYYVVVTNPANGCTTTSDSTTSINELSVISNQLSVYPNPFNNNITVKINSSAQQVNEWSLQLTDVLGRTVYYQPSLNYSNDIDLSDLPSGMYFITVLNKTARAVLPVVKQN